MLHPRHTRFLVLIPCVVLVLTCACEHALRQDTSPSSVSENEALLRMTGDQAAQASASIGLNPYDPYPGGGTGDGEIGLPIIIEDPAAQLSIVGFFGGFGPYVGGQSFQVNVLVRNSGTITLFNINVYLTFGGYPYLSAPSMTGSVPLEPGLDTFSFDPGSILTATITVFLANDATTQDPVKITAFATGSNGMAFASAPPVSINIAVIAAAPQNQPPVASFTENATSVLVGETILFTSMSTDADGSIESWSWDFGDRISGNGSSCSHAYLVAGNYTVTLAVEDDGGAQVIMGQNITIINPLFNGNPNELSEEISVFDRQRTLITSNTVIFLCVLCAGFVLVSRQRRMSSRRIPDSLV